MCAAKRERGAESDVWSCSKHLSAIRTHFRLMAAVHNVIDVYSIFRIENDIVCWWLAGPFVSAWWHWHRQHITWCGINASITYCFVIFPILLLLRVHLTPAWYRTRIELTIVFSCTLRVYVRGLCLDVCARSFRKWIISFWNYRQMRNLFISRLYGECQSQRQDAGRRQMLAFSVQSIFRLNVL